MKKSLSIFVVLLLIRFIMTSFIGDTPRLIPMDQGPEIRQKVSHFRNIIDQLQSGIITMGSFFHPEFVENPKAPFIAPIRKILMSIYKNINDRHLFAFTNVN